MRKPLDPSLVLSICADHLVPIIGDAIQMDMGIGQPLVDGEPYEVFLLDDEGVKVATQEFDDVEDMMLGLGEIIASIADEVREIFEEQAEEEPLLEEISDILRDVAFSIMTPLIGNMS